MWLAGAEIWSPLTIFFQRLAVGNLFDAPDGFKNILNDVLDLAGHQKTRTAVRSISARSIG
jgi:hypothetical protein